MKRRLYLLSRPLAILLAVLLFHTQLASAAGCDVPMFGGARLFSTPPAPQMAVTADFNSDKVPDLALVNSKGVSVLLGNGDGTFQPAANYPIGSPSALAAGDFNGDGKLDLVVSDSTTNGILFLAGKGDGTFAAPIAAEKGQSTSAMAIGDFNGDGKLDLAIGGAPAYLLLGKGDGTFGSIVFPAGNSFFAGFGVGVGDFNGDGKLDVVAGSTDGVFLMLGDGKGNLAAPVDISTGSSPSQVVVADVNGDKKLDVVTFNGIYNSFSVLLGNGNGTFKTATYPGPVSPLAVSLSSNMVVADLTGDGILDVAMSTSTSFPWNDLFGGPALINGTVGVYAGNGDGTFQPPVLYNPTGEPLGWLAAADFNGDGRPDLAFTEPVTQAPTQVGVMLANTDGTLQSPRPFSAGQIPRSPVLADFNGDGFADLVVAHAGLAGTITVMLGNGDGSFQPGVDYPTAMNAASVAVGDVNGDGKPDLVVENAGAFNILTFLGNGDGTFQNPASAGALFLQPGGHVALGDFNNDGKLDAAASSPMGVMIFLGNGDGTFRAGGSFGLGLLAAATNPMNGPISVGDLNGDGNLDLVVPASDVTNIPPFNGGNVYVLLGKGDGTFQAPVTYTVGMGGMSGPIGITNGDGATGVAIGDLNGDGKPDLVVSLSPVGNFTKSGYVAVLLGNGDGTFQAPVRYAVSGSGALGLLVADFNGDGNLDVASISGADKSVSVLLGKGDGTFRDPISYGAGANPMGIAVGDLNADGKPDLVVVDDVSSAVWSLLNNYAPSANSSCAAISPLSN